MPSYNAPERLILTSPSTALNMTNDPTVQGTDSNFTTFFSQTLTFPPRTRVAVESVSMTLSYTNINAQIGNNIIGYNIGGGSTTSFTIPDGSYNVVDISTFIQQKIGNSNIALGINLNTLQVSVSLSGNYQLDLRTGKLYQYLGFTSPVLITTQGTTFGQGIVNINTVNSLLLHSNIANGSYINGNASNILCVFQPTVGPGELLVYTPPQKVFQIITSHNVPFINLYLTDQNNNILNLNGQAMSVSLVFDFVHPVDVPK